jgi:hypothetical protein
MSNTITINPQPKIAHSNKLTDFFYANIIINNDNTDKNIEATYTSTQNLPLIGRQEDFEMRVVRFKIPMGTVPLFLYKSNTYYISIGKGVDRADPSLISDVVAPIEVQFTQKFQADPNMPKVYQQGVYAIEDFLREVNDAIGEAWINILAPIVPTSFPYIKLVNNAFEFVMPLVSNATVGGDLTNVYSEWFPIKQDGYRLLMSAPLYTLFEGFSSYRWSAVTGLVDTGGTSYPELQYAITINDYSVKDVFQVPTAPGQYNNTGNRVDFYNTLLQGGADVAEQQGVDYFHCYKQGQSSVYAWLQASRILITSSMSVVREAILIAKDDNRPERLELLTDFFIEQNNLVSHREYIYYNDQGNERYMNLKDEGPLRRVDMRVFIEFEQGALIPLFIMPGAEINLKLGFRRKWHNDLYQISDPERHTKGP